MGEIFLMIIIGCCLAIGIFIIILPFKMSMDMKNLENSYKKHGCLRVYNHQIENKF